MSRIFISYRRIDSVTITGRIHDRLEDSYGDDNVFKDVDDIPLGADFRTVLDDEVGACDVLLVIIGPTWLDGPDDEGNRRLDNPDDFVRIEIEAGLKRDDVLVIPVLVKGAGMPSSADLPPSLRELAYRNAAIIRDDPDFRRDMHRLIRQIDQHLEAVGTKSPSPPSQPVQTVPPVVPHPSAEAPAETPTRTSLPVTWIAAAGALLVVAVVVIGLLATQAGSPSESDLTGVPSMTPDVHDDGTIDADDHAFIYASPDDKLALGVSIDPDNPELAQEILFGVQLALEDRHIVEVDGGEWGFDMDVREATCSAEEGSNVAGEFVAGSWVLGVVGHACDENCRGAASVYDQAYFTMISPVCAAADLVTDGYPSFNRTVPSEGDRGAKTTEFILNDLGISQIVTIHDENDFAGSFVSSVSEHYSALGGEVLDMLVIDSDESDYMDLLSYAAELEPEAIVYAGNPEAGARLEQQWIDVGLMTERQHPIPLILGNGEDKEIFADELGIMGGVIYAVYPEVSITDRGYDIMQRYHDTYGMDASLALLHSFDAATMFIDAVEASGWIDEDGDLVIERVSLNEYIRTFDGEGAVQEISCDGTGDCGRTQFIFYTLDNGDFVEYTRS